MQFVLKALLLFALTATAAFAQADPPARVARLNHVLGAVSFAPAEAPNQWTQAVINRPLTGGDRLWADRDGRGEFHVGSTAVRLAPLTSLDVLYLDDDRMQLRLAQGTANLRVRDLDSDDLVEISTPAGAVIVRRAGSYRISVDPHSDVVRVAVNFGQAEVVTPQRSFAVPTGQTALVNAYGQPVFEIAQASSDDFDRWSTERDRREDRIESTRYVSPHMTGHEDLDAHGTWRTVPEYGAVWVPARVERGWAPYRQGHWSWIAPWGWTWVDDAPWGFAPFHYGRWVMVHDHWAWAPGPIVRRPVYAPALVAFVGGSSWGVSLRSGPAVGWFPLGWREPYRPWYRASHAHARNVNFTHVSHVTNVYNTHVTHVHRHRVEAVTVVPQQAFVSARSMDASRVRIAHGDLAAAQLIQGRSPAAPMRASVAPERPGQRPPAQATAREVVAVSQPSVIARDLPPEPGVTSTRASEEPRVRVLGRDRDDSRRAHGTGMQEHRSAATPLAGPSASASASASPLAPPAAAAATPAAAGTAPATPAARSVGNAAGARPAPAQTVPVTPAPPTARVAQLPAASSAAPVPGPAAAAVPAAAVAAPAAAIAPQVRGDAQMDRAEITRERVERRRESDMRSDAPRNRGEAILERNDRRAERLQQRAEAAPGGAAPAPRSTPAVREAPVRSFAGPAPVVPSAATPALPQSDSPARAQRIQQRENGRQAGAAVLR